MTDFSRYAIPPFPTRAVIIVNGVMYYEWTSVSVRCELNGNPPRTFRFTCSEQVPVGAKLALMQIVPVVPCTIILDSNPVINGLVTTRQVYYSATEHAIEIQGEDWAGWTAKAPAQSQTGEFKGPAVSIIQSLAAPVGLGVEVLGDVNNISIPRFSIQPGETTWEAVERIARHIGAYISSDASGRTMQLLGPNSVLGDDEVVEGINIVEARETIHSLMNAAEQSVIGQAPRTDDTDQATATQGHVTVPGLNSFGITPGVGARSLAELPAFTLEWLQSRATHEATISSSNEIRVDVTLAGWQRPAGGLWVPGQTVFVKSPMLVMNDMPLLLHAVDFTQDNRGGTRATLELTNQPVGTQPFATEGENT